MTGMTENVLDVLHTEIRAGMNQQSDMLSEGTMPDYAEYKYTCGVIYGLALAERELLSLKQRVEEVD